MFGAQTRRNDISSSFLTINLIQIQETLFSIKIIRFAQQTPNQEQSLLITSFSSNPMIRELFSYIKLHRVVRPLFSHRQKNYKVTPMSIGREKQ